MSSAKFITDDGLNTAYELIMRFSVELRKFEIVDELKVRGYGVACEDGVHLRLARPVETGGGRYVEELVLFCELGQPGALEYYAFHLAHDMLANLLLPRTEGCHGCARC